MKLYNLIVLMLVSFLTININVYAVTPEQDAMQEFKSIYTECKNKPELNIDICAYVKITKCAKKKNPYCAYTLGERYYNAKEYFKAYPYLLDGVGMKFDNGADFALADAYLGNMFVSGLGVEKNKAKAIEHYNKCLSAGISICAYNLSTLFPDDHKKVYALTVIARKLGMNELYFPDNVNVDISIAIESMKQMLGKQKTKEGDKLADEICATIPKCKQSKI